MPLTLNTFTDSADSADSMTLNTSTSTDSIPFSVFSLMVWGSPGSFGVEDKETRMAAIGTWIAQDTEHDVWLLNDLWMRPDHDTIKMLLPEGWFIQFKFD